MFGYSKFSLYLCNVKHDVCETSTFKDLLLLVSKTMLAPCSEHLEHFLLSWKFGKT